MSHVTKSREKIGTLVFKGIQSPPAEMIYGSTSLLRVF